MWQNMPMEVHKRLMPTYFASLATFLTGSFLWWLLITRKITITIKRGVWVGTLIGLISPLSAWFLSLPVHDSSMSFFQVSWLGVLSSFLYIAIAGWITVPCSALVGGMLAHLQRGRSVAEVFKEPHKAQKKFGAATAILIFLFMLTCVHDDGPYRGKVVEMATGNPIEGAVVAAQWSRVVFAFLPPFFDFKETVTDENGEFRIPRDCGITSPFGKIRKPDVVIFKPGYLGYPPLGASPEERKVRMPGLTGREFVDKKQYAIIRLGRPKTRQEREFTVSHAESLFHDDNALRKLPNLLKLTNEECRSLGTGERKGPSNGGGRK